MGISLLIGEFTCTSINDSSAFTPYVSVACSGAVDNVQNAHNYTNTTAQTANAVLQAGMDTDCGRFLSADAVTQLVEKQELDPKLLDTALGRLFRVQMRLGFFDSPSLNKYAKWGPEKVDTPAHRALAKEAADQSLVLLKNEKAELPLAMAGRDGLQLSLAVLGPSANATHNMQGNYYGQAPYLVSALEGLSKYAVTTYANGSDVGEASALAQAADVTVLVVGLNSEGIEEVDGPLDEAEGIDRESLTMPRKQNSLVEAVASASKRTILVVMSGGPVDIEQFKTSDKVQAIIW
jgi:hypothetical protein